MKVRFRTMIVVLVLLMAHACLAGTRIDSLARCLVEAQLAQDRSANPREWRSVAAFLDSSCGLGPELGVWSADSIVDGWRLRRWMPKAASWSYSQMTGLERDGHALFRSVLRLDSIGRLSTTEFDEMFSFLESGPGHWNESKTFRSRVFGSGGEAVVVVGSTYGVPELRIDFRNKTAENQTIRFDRQSKKSSESRALDIDTLDLDSGADSRASKARTIVVKGCLLGDPAGNVVAICGEQRKSICLDATLNRERMRKSRKWFVESTVGRCGLFRGRLVSDKNGMRIFDLTPTISQALVRVDHRPESPCTGRDQEER